MKSKRLPPERAENSRTERLSFDPRDIVTVEVIRPLSAMNRLQHGGKRWSV